MNNDKTVGEHIVDDEKENSILSFMMRYRKSLTDWERIHETRNIGNKSPVLPVQIAN